MKKRELVEVKNKQGKVIAREENSFQDKDYKKPEGMTRFTGFIKFDKGADAYYEEIDVDAINSKAASAAIKLILARDYIAGGKLAKIQARFGLYF